MSAAALILLGHGARDPAWAQPLQRIRQQALALAPGGVVELAFLEFMRPTLEDAVAALTAAGARRIRVVPVFLAQGGHLKRDLPLRIDALRGEHPGCELEVSAAVGEDAGVIAAIAACALATKTS
ncbi:cobalamin biosynthesis protein CbiX [Betaproteobacteria bacterium]|nr:cobalamin biosynthesis protein CbiX [Betaproteobacteria bacterium]GHU04637.1 cobalamin biosynthesis protein CbiX [Betaproteobacteria bacterium]GHU20635.1 cobalamin biosynthesis protein CbiX [Betaproteobacteria bacterium]